ncbi:DUF1003 domain-containing protein [Candidatus Peregrinibacteria bacterium]|nr:DUF1003 domain-containing protein [Candidatus Peregrinibacteria bacterium]
MLERNIRTLSEVRAQMERRKGMQEKMADAVTSFTGSVLFVYIHVIWFLAWLVFNLGLTPFPSFDPFPFGLLTMIVSLEAIFLSTFVLISQNRMSQMSERRSDLDLQVNLLAEYEITKLLRLSDALADHFNLKEGRDRELEQLKVEIQPQDVLQEMERGGHHVF